MNGFLSGLFYHISGGFMFFGLIFTVQRYQTFHFTHFDSDMVEFFSHFTFYAVTTRPIKRIGAGRRREVHGVDPISFAVEESTKMHAFATAGTGILYSYHIADDLNGLTDVIF